MGTGMLVIIVRLGLSWSSLEAVQRRLERWGRLVDTPRERGEPERASADRVVWAVRTTSRYVPAASCLTQALAAHTLLDRRGLENELRIGVARNERREFEAHAWIEIDGEVVLGELDDLDRYTPFDTARTNAA